jgi:hypothetical protein
VDNIAPVCAQQSADEVKVDTKPLTKEEQKREEARKKEEQKRKQADAFELQVCCCQLSHVCIVRRNRLRIVARVYGMSQPFERSHLMHT